MSRSVSPALALAANNAVRYPVSQVIFRDMRLRFQDDASVSGPWIMSTNPAGAQDTSFLIGLPDVMIDAAVGDACIGRVMATGGKIYYSEITNPQNAAQWSSWSDIGATADTYQNPGITWTGSAFYVFYMHGGHVCKRSHTPGSGWSGETDTTVALPDYVTLAPISDTVCYAALCSGASTGMMQMFRISGSAATEFPWRLYGNNDQSITINSTDSSSFFDAYTLSGVPGEFIVFTHGKAQQVYKCRYLNGVIGPKQTILPTYNDDTNGFIVYRVSVINDGTRDVAWLTGHIYRFLNVGSVANQIMSFDIYLKSIDGWNWSHLTRNSFLSVGQIQGQFLCPAGDDYVYYAGNESVFRALKIFGIDGSDPVGKKVVATDELMTASIQFPGQGTAPTATIDLAAGRNQYLTGQKARVVSRGGEAWIYGGYRTQASPGGEMPLLEHVGIDSVRPTIANGQRAFEVTCRDIAYKNQKTWVSPLFWDFRSQLKHNGTDDMNSADNGAGWTNSSACGGGWNGPTGPWSPNGPQAGQDLVYAADQAKFGRTGNFTASSPTWADITAGLSGAIYDFCLDPWDTGKFSHNGTTLEVVYCTTAAGIYRTANAKSYSPSWALVCSAATFNAATGATVDTFGYVKSTIAQQDLIYAQAIAHIGGSYYVYVGTTQDAGIHWVWSLAGSIPTPSMQYGFAVSQWHAGVVMVAYTPGVYKSSDYASSFSLVGAMPTIPDNIELPYQNNADDLQIICSGGGASGGGGGYSITWGSLTPNSFSDGHVAWSIAPAGSTQFSASYHIGGSDDGGYEWISLSTNQNFTLNGFNPGDALIWRTTYLVTSTGLYLGTTWNQYPPPSPFMQAAHGYGSYDIPNQWSEAPGLGNDTFLNLSTGAARAWATVLESGRSMAGSWSWDVLLELRSVNGIPVIAQGYVQTTIDGGANWLDATHGLTNGLGLHGINSDVMNTQHLTLAATNQIVESIDFGATAWVTLASGLVFPATAIGRWPYDSHTIYLGDGSHWYWSDDNGATLQDKTGDWGTISSPRNIVPCYLSQ